jgi:hypothetical protein
MFKFLKLRNLTAFECTLIKAWFCACIFIIGACFTMLGQNMRIMELESHIASMQDEDANADAIAQVN